MPINITKTEIIDFQQYRIIFAELIEKIVNKLSNIIKNNPKEENTYQIVVKEILDTTSQIEEYLKHNHVIKEEYYDFADIHDLIEEVLTENFTSDRIQIIINILKRLNEITEYKLNLMNSKNNILTKEDIESFKKEYFEFERDLFYFKMGYYKGCLPDKRAKEYFEIFREDLMED